MSFLKSLPAKLGQVLALYGGWGLFAISFLDSSFVPFPVVNDLLLLHLSIQRPTRMLVYALQATVGSVLGAYALYAIGRRGGQFAFRRTSPAWKARAEHWLKRNDFVSGLVASVLPPPAPFKIFLLTAGALRVNALRFGTALLVGRGLRFMAEGLVAVRYGARAEAYLKQNAAWISLVAAALVVGMALAYRRFAKRPPAELEANAPSSSDTR